LDSISFKLFSTFKFLVVLLSVWNIYHARRHHSRPCRSLACPCAAASAPVVSRNERVMDDRCLWKEAWQKAIIAPLNLMTCPASSTPSPRTPAFLCAPAGGGKSIARDCFVAVDRATFPGVFLLPCRQPPPQSQSLLVL
jgi:hypothetical protein